MKNRNNLVFPAEAVELSHLRPDEPVCIHVGENTIVAVPQNMTAMEAVNALNVLDGVVSELLETFREACGGCEDQAEGGGCPAGCELPMDSRGGCPYKDIHGPQVTLSDSIRREMGIAPDAKVDCFVDEGELVVTAADYEHDITDVPENIRLMLSIAGVCPGRLDELLRDGAEVWHG